MINDQTSPQFLDQLKNFARGFLSWVSEEGAEPEHPGVTPDEQPASDQQPAPVRTRTTTVTDYSPLIATDPPVSQAQRAAMGAAASGKSNLGIPKSVGQEFIEADPGGKLPKTADNIPSQQMATDPLTSKGEKIMSSMKEQYGPEKGEQVFYASKNAGKIGGVDNVTTGQARGIGGGPFSRTAIEERQNPIPAPTAGQTQDDEERFELSPDGSRIIDKQSGSSYSIEDAMRILFSGNDAAEGVHPPEVQEPSPVTTSVPTGKWTVPKISARGNDDGPGEGVGGKILGQLLKYKAGQDDTMQGQPLSQKAQQGWNVPVWKSR